MGIPARQIGWGTQENLLWQIAKQIEQTECQLCTLNSNIQSITGTSGTSGSSGVSGSSGTSGNDASLDYLAAYSTDDFTGGSIQALTYNNVDFSNGVSIANNSEITFTKLGKFNIQFSLQLVKTGGAGTNIYIWLRHNGVDVPNSATVLEMGNNNQYLVAAWNFFVDVNTNPQTFELVWYTPSANVSIETLSDAETPAGVPGVPSIILTVNQVGV